MAEKTLEIHVEVRNADGMHMRPAMLFVDLASTFACDIKVHHGDVQVDGKSIMQMTMLAATSGSKLKIVAKGDDAENALVALRELVEDRMFNEPPM